MHRWDTNCMAYCLQVTSKALTAIVNTLETCYHMLTHSKLAIPYVDMFETWCPPYVDMFETWYTLHVCRHVWNLVYLMSTHSKLVVPYVNTFEMYYRYLTVCRHIPNLLYLMSTCQHSKTNIEGLSTLQLTILCQLAMQTSIQLVLPPFVM